MILSNDNGKKRSTQIERRYEAVRNEVFEPHLFNDDAAEEKSYCGRDNTRVERMGVREYVNERLNASRPRAVCPECKALAMPLVEVNLNNMAEDFEDKGRLGDAEDCSNLFGTMSREIDGESFGR